MNDILVANAALNDVERLIKYVALLQGGDGGILTTQANNLNDAWTIDVVRMNISIVRHQLMSLLRLLLCF